MPLPSGGPHCSKKAWPRSPTGVERTHLLRLKLSTLHHVANRSRVPLPAARPREGPRSTACDLDHVGRGRGILKNSVGRAEAIGANGGRAECGQAIPPKQTAKRLTTYLRNLRAAEQRIREVEAKVRLEDWADRAERWVYKVWVEVEQKFFGGDAAPFLQPPYITHPQGD